MLIFPVSEQGFEAIFERQTWNKLTTICVCKCALNNDWYGTIYHYKTLNTFESDEFFRAFRTWRTLKGQLQNFCIPRF